MAAPGRFNCSPCTSSDPPPRRPLTPGALRSHVPLVRREKSKPLGGEGVARQQGQERRASAAEVCVKGDRLEGDVAGDVGC